MDGSRWTRERVEQALDRVAEVEPSIRAFVPEADRRGRVLREAEAAAAGPLRCVAIGVKDVIRVDGLPTGAGSDVPAEELAGPQAPCVTAMRAAGAVVLGKTVTAEFASVAPGPTRNPRNPDHTPGGSSSGSAAAVAAGCCPLALGTQTVGSVIRPAAYCGVVGWKPSLGRVPTGGVIEYSCTFDTVGVLAGDVAWAARAAAVLCSEWAAAGSADRPVLGVPEGPYLEQASAEALAAFAAQVARLEAAGYRVVRVPALADIAEVNHRHHVITRVEFARRHEALFARYGDRYREQTAASIRFGRGIPDAEYEAAVAAHSRLREELAAAMASAGIDAWICPAAPGPAPLGIETTGDPIMNVPWTHAGLPAVSVPAGAAANGLPLGLQVAAGFGADERLLAWAAGLEGTLGAG